MSKFSKLIRLIILLKCEARMKSKDIASTLDISERMVRKYINDLIDAGVDVISITGPTGGYELRGYDYLLNINITKEELISLEVLYEKLNTDENLAIIENIKTLIEKLKIQSSSINKYNDFSKNITLNSVVNKLPLQNNIELDIQKNILLNNKLKIDYMSNKNEVTQRVIHPYKIITRNNFKYVVAYCETKKNLRVFKLIRINKIETLNEKFSQPENMKDLLKANNLGIMYGEDIHVKLHIKPPFSCSVSDRIYSSNQSITYNEDNSIIFEADLNGKEDIIRWILSMKSCVTILEPLSLKEEIKKELTNMINII